MQLCNPLQILWQEALQVMTLSVRTSRQAKAALKMMRVQHSLRALQHNLTCD